jgi:hypothetical protein
VLDEALDNDWGTGNQLPTYYDSNGGLRAGNAHMQSQVAVSSANGYLWSRYGWSKAFVPKSPLFTISVRKRFIRS